MKPYQLLLGTCLAMGLISCGDSDSSPTQSKADLLLGTWHLEATQGESAVASLVNVSYAFQPDGGVRQRIGGEFLRALREREAVQAALEGEELSNTNRIDGANLNWIGQWTLNGDSLHVVFDLLIVEVFGDIPILGKITVPVFEEDLAPAAQTQLDYVCELVDGVLTLHGTSSIVGIDADGGSQDVTAQINGIAGQVAQQAVELLATQLDGHNTQVYVRR